jgi:hypothetical protein
MAACIRVAPRRDHAQRAKENHEQAPRGQKMCSGNRLATRNYPTGRRASQRSVLGVRTSIFSRLLSGSEGTIAPLLVLRQPADFTGCPLLVDHQVAATMEDWQMVETRSPPAWSSRILDYRLEDSSSGRS